MTKINSNKPPEVDLGYHYPPTIKAKQAATNAMWESKWVQAAIESKAKAAALAEQKRRAECYPDLLAALERFIDYEAALENHDDVGGLVIYAQFYKMARAAIDAAHGIKEKP